MRNCFETRDSLITIQRVIVVSSMSACVTELPRRFLIRAFRGVIIPICSFLVFLFLWFLFFNLFPAVEIGLSTNLDVRLLMNSCLCLVGGLSSSEESSVYSFLTPGLRERRLAAIIVVLVDVDVAFLRAPSKASGVIS